MEPASWFNKPTFEKWVQKTSAIFHDEDIKQAKAANDASEVVKLVETFLKKNQLKTALYVRELLFLLAMPNLPPPTVENQLDEVFINATKERLTLPVEIFDELNLQIKEVKIDMAMSYCRLLRGIMKKIPEPFELVKSDFQPDHASFMNKINETENNYRRIIEQEKQINSNDYWDSTQVANKGGGTLSYKKMKDGSLKVLSNFLTKANLFNFLGMLNEIDLYHTWIPFLKKSYAFKEIGDFSKAAVMEFNVGKFLFSREACMIAFGWDRLLHRGCMAIECKSLHKVFSALL